jgi:hypothetical protein
MSRFSRGSQMVFHATPRQSASSRSSVSSDTPDGPLPVVSANPIPPLAAAHSAPQPLRFSTRGSGRRPGRGAYPRSAHGKSSRASGAHSSAAAFSAVRRAVTMPSEISYSHRNRASPISKVKAPAPAEPAT